MCAVFIIIHKTIEHKYITDNEQLLQEYEDIISHSNGNADLYRATSTDAVPVQDTNVDCILIVDDLDIKMPICKGNFKSDIERYRLSVYDVNMVLGNTTYTIMGHHAISYKYAFGWLEDLKKDTIIKFERYGNIYEYYVDEINIGYAADMSYLFTLNSEDVVYLATCDYSLGNKGKIVYRSIKCTRLN